MTAVAMPDALLRATRAFAELEYCSVERASWLARLAWSQWERSLAAKEGAALTPERWLGLLRVTAFYANVRLVPGFERRDAKKVTEASG